MMVKKGYTVSMKNAEASVRMEEFAQMGLCIGHYFEEKGVRFISVHPYQRMGR